MLKEIVEEVRIVPGRTSRIRLLLNRHGPAEETQETFDSVSFFSFNIYKSALTIPSTSPHRSFTTTRYQTQNNQIRDHMYKTQQTFSPSYTSARVCYSSILDYSSRDRFGQAITFFLLFTSSTSTYSTRESGSWTTKTACKFREKRRIRERFRIALLLQVLTYQLDT